MSQARYAKAAVRNAAGQNRTEQQYHLLLMAREASGEISQVRFEAITLKIGKDCRYTPDFSLIASDGVFEFHEVKAGYLKHKIVKGKLVPKADSMMTEGGRMRLHVAAEMFPFRFRLATLAGGRWILEDV